MQRSTKASNKAVKKAKLVRKAYKAVEAANDPNPSLGQGLTEKDRRFYATEREKLRRYHDRALLHDTLARDKAWVKAGDGTRPKAFPTERMKQIQKLFGTTDWPNTDIEWLRYDRERSLALKDIHDARALRGYGDFDLVAYIRNGSHPPDIKESKALTSDHVTEPKASSIEPLEFDQSFSGALDDIEAGALVFNPSFKRALDSDDDEPLGNKRAKITQPQNLSPQARQIHENNERGTELIRKMLVLEREKECAGGDLFTAKRYAELRRLFRSTWSLADTEELESTLKSQRDGMQEVETLITKLRSLGFRRTTRALPMWRDVGLVPGSTQLAFVPGQSSTTQLAFAPGQSSTQLAFAPATQLAIRPGPNATDQDMRSALKSSGLQRPT